MSWTLTYSGTTKSLADWSISSLVRSTRSQGEGQLTFVVSGPDFDATGFAFGAEIVITRDTTQWFRGRVSKIPRSGTPEMESVTYIVSDAWYDLNQVTYQGNRLCWPDSTSILARTPHITMNLGTDGSHFTAKQMIECVINYAIAAGVALQIGQILPDAEELMRPPLDDVSSLTCAQVIQRQLRWIPNAITWIDYTTSPPTFHCRIRSKLVSQTLTIHPKTGSPATGAVLVADGEITSRNDLQFPAVEILYESRNSVDGEEKFNFLYDLYPGTATGRELGALVMAIPIQGYSVQTIQASILVEEIDTASLDWWKARFPYLAHANVVSPAVTFESRLGELPNELKLGQFATWMKLDNGTPGSVEDDVIKARVAYTIREQGGTTELGKPYDFPLSYKCVTTDLESGDYSIISAFEESDPIPVGLAQFLYDQCSALQWEGTVRSVAEECIGTVGVGHRLNLAGGMAAWATMAAIVQEVIEDVDRGETKIRFGPPPHLQASDLMELLKVARQRKRDTPVQMSVQGKFGTGTVELGKANANENGTGGEGALKLLVLKDAARKLKLDCSTSADGAALVLYDANGTTTITLKTADAKDFEDTKRSLTIREVEVCVSGVTQRMLVLGSAAYDPPD
jgi:hypothetical protein